MTLWTFDPARLALTDGTDITSAHAAPDSWSSTHRNGTGTLKWYSGQLPLQSQAGTNEFAQARRSSLSFTRLSVEGAFDQDPAPSAESRLYEFRSGAPSGRAAFANIGTDNRIRIFNTSAGLLHHFVTDLDTLTDWRFYMGVKPGTTASNGSVHARLYATAAATTAVESWEFDNVDAGTAALTELRLGWVSNVVQKLRLRYVRMEDASLAPIGPITAATPPVITLGPDVSGVEPKTVVTVTATHTGGTAPDGWAWRQISGPTVTLTGTGASRSFTAPSTFQGAAVVIGCTPAAGASVGTEDAITVNVTPQPMWARPAGAASMLPAGPVQVIAWAALFGLTASATPGLYDLTIGSDVREAAAGGEPVTYVVPTGSRLTLAAEPGFYDVPEV